jgi:hypothetical protein
MVNGSFEASFLVGHARIVSNVSNIGSVTGGSTVATRVCHNSNTGFRTRLFADAAVGGYGCNNGGVFAGFLPLATAGFD